jgi:hypothetical protein
MFEHYEWLVGIEAIIKPWIIASLPLSYVIVPPQARGQQKQNLSSVGIPTSSRSIIGTGWADVAGHEPNTFVG